MCKNYLFIFLHKHSPISPNLINPIIPFAYFTNCFIPFFFSYLISIQYFLMLIYLHIFKIYTVTLISKLIIDTVSYLVSNPLIVQRHRTISDSKHVKNSFPFASFHFLCIYLLRISIKKTNSLLFLNSKKITGIEIM